MDTDEGEKASSRGCFIPVSEHNIFFSFSQLGDVVQALLCLRTQFALCLASEVVCLRAQVCWFFPLTSFPTLNIAAGGMVISPGVYLRGPGSAREATQSHNNPSVLT